jgi:hypothetical protein
MTEPIDESVLDRADEADVQEQAQPTVEGDEAVAVSTSDEVDAYDAAEQGRPVELDQEEYR